MTFNRGEWRSMAVVLGYMMVLAMLCAGALWMLGLA